MNVKKFVVALMIAFAPSIALCADEEPKMTVTLSPEKVFEGQSVTYRVVVENVENPPTPELRGTDDFDMAFLGQRSLDSQQITVINGVMQQSVKRGREYHYRVTPKRTGQLTIPAPVLTVGGKTLTGTEQRLLVEPPNAQDLVAVELTADRQTVYPTQPFTVTLSIFVKQLPPPFADRDPVAVQRRPPMLKIPWLTDQELPAALASKEDWQTWVKGFINREGGGFGINELVQNTAFSFSAREAP